MLSQCGLLVLYLWLDESTRLQDQALVLLLLLCQESSSGGRLKDILNTHVGFGGAFDVFVGTDTLFYVLTLEWRR